MKYNVANVVLQPTVFADCPFIPFVKYKGEHNVLRF